VNRAGRVKAQLEATTDNPVALRSDLKRILNTAEGTTVLRRVGPSLVSFAKQLMLGSRHGRSSR
jgi:hypothetical protein